DAEIVVDARPWKGDGSAGGESRRMRLETGANIVRVPVRLAQPHEWSVADPFLYVGEATVRMSGQPADEVTARFGLREFTVGGDGAFYLNGKPFFVKGAHYQSTEPMTLAFPRSQQAARQIVEIAKEGGFNFIRG